MAKQGFWTKERMLPGEPLVGETADTYWVLKLIHPPSASAMAPGALGGGYLAWKLVTGYGLVALLIAVPVAALAAAWVGLLLYWLLRMILGFGG